MDESFGKSYNDTIVRPEGLIDTPQTHYVKLRTQEPYLVEHNGKFVKNTEGVYLDVTSFIG